jgi:hypothetical protein
VPAPEPDGRLAEVGAETRRLDSRLTARKVGSVDLAPKGVPSGKPFERSPQVMGGSGGRHELLDRLLDTP